MPRFYNGQPVVCVKGGMNPNANSRYPGLRWPVKGRRYIIRNAEVPQRGRMTFVLVSGIRNRVITWPCGARFEAGFHEDRFEPATNIKLLEDIRDFAGMQYERTKKGMPPGVRRVPVKPRKKEDA